MKIQQVYSYIALNNDQLLYAFVDYSADIEVVITELLEFMAVCGKVYHLSQSLSMKRDLNDELTARCTD